MNPQPNSSSSEGEEGEEEEEGEEDEGKEEGEEEEEGEGEEEEEEEEEERDSAVNGKKPAVSIPSPGNDKETDTELKTEQSGSTQGPRQGPHVASQGEKPTNAIVSQQDRKPPVAKRPVCLRPRDAQVGKTLFTHSHVCVCVCVEVMPGARLLAYPVIFSRTPPLEGSCLIVLISRFVLLVQLGSSLTAWHVSNEYSLARYVRQSSIVCSHNLGSGSVINRLLSGSLEARG